MSNESFFAAEMDEVSYDRGPVVRALVEQAGKDVLTVLYAPKEDLIAEWNWQYFLNEGPKSKNALAKKEKELLIDHLVSKTKEDKELYADSKMKEVKDNLKENGLDSQTMIHFLTEAEICGIYSLEQIKDLNLSTLIDMFLEYVSNGSSQKGRKAAPGSNKGKRLFEKSPRIRIQELAAEGQYTKQQIKEKILEEYPSITPSYLNTMLYRAKVDLWKNGFADEDPETKIWTYKEF